MNISTLAGLNLPQEPTSAEDIHICYLQYILSIIISITINIFSNVDRLSICKHPQRAIVKPSNVDA